MPELPWIFTRLDLRSLFDILAVAIIFFWLLWVAQGTRATQLIRGLAIFVVVVVGVANVFNLTALNRLLALALPALIVAVPIVFQPELRRALEQLGHTGSWLRPPFSTQPESNLERTVEEISLATTYLARHRYGSLIVVERETGLQDYVDRGILVDALITRSLLINIFYPNTPLHDGAVIVRNDRILAGGCVLPLSENVTGGQLGTRHRAGIGITEESDAISIIVSEETGRISVAHNGRLVRDLDRDRLRRVLSTLLRLDHSERSTSGQKEDSSSDNRKQSEDVERVEQMVEENGRTRAEKASTKSSSRRRVEGTEQVTDDAARTTTNT